MAPKKQLKLLPYLLAQRHLPSPPQHYPPRPRRLRRTTRSGRTPTRESRRIVGLLLVLKLKELKRLLQFQDLPPPAPPSPAVTSTPRRRRSSSRRFATQPTTSLRGPTRRTRTGVPSVGPMWREIGVSRVMGRSSPLAMAQTSWWSAAMGRRTASGPRRPGATLHTPSRSTVVSSLRCAQGRLLTSLSDRWQQDGQEGARRRPEPGCRVVTVRLRRR